MMPFHYGISGVRLEASEVDQKIHRKRPRLSAMDESNVLGVCPRLEKLEDRQHD
jgi:hypothetical protein